LIRRVSAIEIYTHTFKTKYGHKSQSISKIEKVEPLRRNF